MITYIGCSGFHYADWKNKFYPENLPKKDWLEFYARKFPAVEINSTFYQIPRKKDLQKWSDKTPDDFKFVFKGYQYITHRKKLNMDQDLLDSLQSFYDGIEPIEHKIGGILWQFPPKFPLDKQRIEKFAGHLKMKFPNFFEFRKTDWFDQETVDFLQEHGLGFVTISAPNLQMQEMYKCNNWIYLRLHGKYNWYNYSYSKEELREFKNQIQKKSPGQTFIFFNNDVDAQAPGNALDMLHLSE